MTWRTGKQRGELIDTLWNVNSFDTVSATGTTRINRYIMECKCKNLNLLRAVLTELIDTLWNVNWEQP